MRCHWGASSLGVGGRSGKKKINMLTCTGYRRCPNPPQVALPLLSRVHEEDDDEEDVNNNYREALDLPASSEKMDAKADVSTSYPDPFKQKYEQQQQQQIFRRRDYKPSSQTSIPPLSRSPVSSPSTAASTLSPSSSSSLDSPSYSFPVSTEKIYHHQRVDNISKNDLAAKYYSYDEYIISTGVEENSFLEKSYMDTGSSTNSISGFVNDATFRQACIAAIGSMPTKQTVPQSDAQSVPFPILSTKTTSRSQSGYRNTEEERNCRDAVSQAAKVSNTSKSTRPTKQVPAQAASRPLSFSHTLMSSTTEGIAAFDDKETVATVSGNFLPTNHANVSRRIIKEQWLLRKKSTHTKRSSSRKSPYEAYVDARDASECGMMHPSGTSRIQPSSSNVNAETSSTSTSSNGSTITARSRYAVAKLNATAQYMQFSPMNNGQCMYLHG